MRGYYESPDPKHEGASPAYLFVLHVWTHASDKSWRTYNKALSDALYIAAESGMRFDPGDIDTFAKKFRGGFWMGASLEHRYAQAVEAGNISACVSFENHLDRKPFMYRGKRLCVGRRFESEDGEPWGWATVTSMATDEIIACAYEPGTNKVARRIRVTRAELASAEKRRRAKSKAPSPSGGAGA